MSVRESQTQTQKKKIFNLIVHAPSAEDAVETPLEAPLGAGLLVAAQRADFIVIAAARSQAFSLHPFSAWPNVRDDRRRQPRSRNQGLAAGMRVDRGAAEAAACA